MVRSVRRQFGRFLTSLVVIVLLISIYPFGVSAQDGEPTTGPGTIFIPLAQGDAAGGGVEAPTPTDEQVLEASGVRETARSIMPPASAQVTLNWLDEPPVLTAAQMATAEAALAMTHLPGPRATEVEDVAAITAQMAPETQSFVRNSVELDTLSVDPSSEKEMLAPTAPGDAWLYRNVAPVTTGGSKSNVMEASAAQGGAYAFYTGNWFAARSITGGSTWSYVNPFADMSDFCCDQVTLYDESRNLLFWYRQSSRTSAGVNRFRLGVSTNGGASFCNYDVAPTNTNSAWTNQWWDYPHLQLGADYLYIATNMFNATPSWTRTVMLRFPLDSLKDCAGFGYNYYSTSSWFTFVPVQGADHIMYFASNGPSTSPFNSRINIWKWAENSTSLSWVTRTVAAWTTSAATCGSSSGNWAGRTDTRLLTGARYMIHNTNLAIPGRKVLGWWWNVAQGGSFGRPHIDGAAFYEDTLTQLSGNQGRPLVWSSTICFLYPSVAANKRGDLGMVLHEGTGTGQNPSVDFAIADDYSGAVPGWSLWRVRTSNARPADNRWGDYNTTRPFFPTGDAWIGGSHYIATSTNCTTCATPVFFTFGRARDYNSWLRWQNK